MPETILASEATSQPTPLQLLEASDRITRELLDAVQKAYELFAGCSRKIISLIDCHGRLHRQLVEAARAPEMTADIGRHGTPWAARNVLYSAVIGLCWTGDFCSIPL